MAATLGASLAVALVVILVAPITTARGSAAGKQKDASAVRTKSPERPAGALSEVVQHLRIARRSTSAQCTQQPLVCVKPDGQPVIELQCPEITVSATAIELLLTVNGADVTIGTKYSVIPNRSVFTIERIEPFPITERLQLSHTSGCCQYTVLVDTGQNDCTFSFGLEAAPMPLVEFSAVEKKTVDLFSVVRLPPGIALINVTATRLHTATTSDLLSNSAQFVFENYTIRARHLSLNDSGEYTISVYTCEGQLGQNSLSVTVAGKLYLVDSSPSTLFLDEQSAGCVWLFCTAKTSEWPYNAEWYWPLTNLTGQYNLSRELIEHENGSMLYNSTLCVPFKDVLQIADLPNCSVSCSIYSTAANSIYKEVHFVRRPSEPTKPSRRPSSTPTAEDPSSDENIGGNNVGLYIGVGVTAAYLGVIFIVITCDYVRRRPNTRSDVIAYLGNICCSRNDPVPQPSTEPGPRCRSVSSQDRPSEHFESQRPNGGGSDGVGSNGGGSNGGGSNGVGSNGVGSNGVGSSGVGSNGVGSNGVGSNGVGSNGVGSNGVGSSGVGSNGVGSNGVGSNGVGSNGVGSNGVRSNGVGSNGVGSSGVGSNGVGSNGVGSNGVGSKGVGRCRSEMQVGSTAESVEDNPFHLVRFVCDIQPWLNEVDADRLRQMVIKKHLITDSASIDRLKKIQSRDGQSAHNEELIQLLRAGGLKTYRDLGVVIEELGYVDRSKDMLSILSHTEFSDKEQDDIADGDNKKESDSRKKARTQSVVTGHSGVTGDWSISSVPSSTSPVVAATSRVQDYSPPPKSTSPLAGNRQEDSSSSVFEPGSQASSPAAASTPEAQVPTQASSGEKYAALPAGTPDLSARRPDENARIGSSSSSSSSRRYAYAQSHQAYPNLIDGEVPADTVMSDYPLLWQHLEDYIPDVLDAWIGRSTLCRNLNIAFYYKAIKSKHGEVKPKCVEVIALIEEKCKKLAVTYGDVVKSLNEVEAFDNLFAWKTIIQTKSQPTFPDAGKSL